MEINSYVIILLFLRKMQFFKNFGKIMFFRSLLFFFFFFSRALISKLSPDRFTCLVLKAFLKIWKKSKNQVTASKKQKIGIFARCEETVKVKDKI